PSSGVPGVYTIESSVFSNRVAVSVGLTETLWTVTLTSGEIAVRVPDVACAVSTCGPLPDLVVSQSTSNGGWARIGPTRLPSTKNFTVPWTLALSDTIALILTEPNTVEPSAGDTIVTVTGEVVSFHTSTCTACDVPMFPVTS